MAPSPKRSVLGILSIILLILSGYVLTKLSSQVSSNNLFYLTLMAGTIFSFNIPILFAWAAFGIVGGLSISIFSILIVLLFNLRMGISVYFIFTLSFFITIFLAWSIWRIKNELISSYILKLEKLDEEINILSNDISQKKSSIYSLEEKLMRYSLLKEVSESLSTVLSLEEINRLIVDRALKILGKIGRALLFLVDVEKQELMLFSSKDDSKVRAKKGDAFDRWVLRNRKTLMIEDVAKDFRFPANAIEESKHIFKSLIATPLISENKVIGILRVDSPIESMYVQDDLRLLDIVADLGAVAIQNALLYSRTQELAIKDSLTGLFVRRYFIERFKEEVKRAARKKDELSLLILDIDHFKDYNDRFGHLSGDLMLRHLSRTINSMLIEGDLVARYGGEEIVILLCGRNKKQAIAEAEEIRKVIKNKPLMLRRHETRTTVSIGLSSYPEDALIEEEMIRIADERLYKAKTGGRDRVCVN